MTEKNNPWENEIKAAERAWREGNDGRARACCRRAVGFVLKAKNIPGTYRTANRNAVELMLELSENDDVPENIRKASIRLTTNVRNRLSPDFTFNPLLDAKIIIDYLLGAVRDES